MSTYRIAVIEDDPIIAQMYQMKFAAEGFEVQAANNGALGVELAEQMKPHIILLDVRMPLMDGPSALAKIRSQPWGKRIPVLVLTNVGEESVAHGMQKLGIEGFIIKANLTPSQVVRRIKKILGIEQPLDA